MKIALVHDYLKEFGGAERVLRVLAEMYPTAPIYTAFATPGSDAANEFKDKKIVESKLAWLIKYFNLHSPLRFLIPWIWSSFDLSDYDVVITSCSGYFARGFKVGKKTKVLAYCHTPPRFLYGYETSIDYQKYWPVKVYAAIVNHYLRQFDFWTAQKVDKYLVNSKNVAERVKKFYRRDAEVVYPPIEVDRYSKLAMTAKRENYFLIVSRLVGAKGLVEAATAANKLGMRIKIAGGSMGYSAIKDELMKTGAELLGRVSDKDLVGLYAKAKGFIALAKQEDFGMTVVESQAAGTPVIAYQGGGFLESVVDGQTGIFVTDTSERAIEWALTKFNKIKWNRNKIIENARRFERKIFEEKIKKAVSSLINNA